MKFDATDCMENKDLKIKLDIETSSDSDSSLSCYSDTEFSDNEHSDTDSDPQLYLPVKKNDIDTSDTEVENELDTSQNFTMARKSALTPQMKMLLNVNVTDMFEDDNIKKEIQDCSDLPQTVPTKVPKLVSSGCQ